MSFSSAKFITGFSKSLLSRFRTNLPTKVSVAGIYTKDQKPDEERPAPFPYMTKKYNLFHQFFDSTIKRFDPNSKIIVVDGNIGAGKTQFAKHIADVFDMKFVAEPDLGAEYITPYGYDLRLIDESMPPSYKYCDIKRFYTNPHFRNVTLMQYKMLMRRYENYIDAFVHLLNTGQGLVLDRCVFGDFIFMEAMHKAGYIRNEAKEYYLEIYESVTEELLKPHLIIYLDITPETALQRIKERNIDYEVNSEVLTSDYLSTIEYYYKQHYLRNLEIKCEMLIYDWNEFGDIDVVVEDICRINFAKYNKYYTKLEDWTTLTDDDLRRMRHLYSNKKYELINYAAIFRPRVTEVFHPPNEVREYDEVMKKVPGGEFVEGYNTSLGDKIWFKMHQYGIHDDKPSI